MHVGHWCYHCTLVYSSCSTTLSSLCGALWKTIQLRCWLFMYIMWVVNIIWFYLLLINWFIDCLLHLSLFLVTRHRIYCYFVCVLLIMIAIQRVQTTDCWIYTLKWLWSFLGYCILWCQIYFIITSFRFVNWKHNLCSYSGSLLICVS